MATTKQPAKPSDGATNDFGYKRFTLGGFKFERDEYFTQITWPGGSGKAPRLDCRARPWTASEPLPGGDLPGADFDAFLKSLTARYRRMPAALLRRYGTVQHAGFGMGIERVVAWICGLEHVRETIPFPRMLERLRP